MTSSRGQIQQPAGNEGQLVVFENKAFRTTTWLLVGRGGKLDGHWAYGASAFSPTRNQPQIEWTPGVLALSGGRGGGLAGGEPLQTTL